MYSKDQVELILALRSQRLKWEEIADEYNEVFKPLKEKSGENMRKTHEKYIQTVTMDDDYRLIQTTRTARRQNSRMRRESNAALDELARRNSLLKEIGDMLGGMESGKIKAVIEKPRKPKKGKRNMIIELMVSDVHYGKKTDQVDLKVIRERMRQVKNTFLFELERAQEHYNVKKAIIALLGDLIESATMHGLESMVGCEFGNSKQVTVAIESLFYDLIRPIAETGIQIDIPAVAGNHDRAEKEKTFHRVGESRLTYTIYKTLEMLCAEAGLTNVKFLIPTESYCTMKIFNDTVLYTHTDRIKNAKSGFEGEIQKRQIQLSTKIDYLRGGHWHEFLQHGRGRVIINESLVGPDDYSNELGYDSKAGQTINFYIDTKRRPTTFYRSFPFYVN